LLSLKIKKKIKKKKKEEEEEEEDPPTGVANHLNGLRGWPNHSLLKKKKNVKEEGWPIHPQGVAEPPL
jgi:hypothetical protein